jgi:hypothetical protein
MPRLRILHVVSDLLPSFPLALVIRILRIHRVVVEFAQVNDGLVGEHQRLTRLPIVRRWIRSPRPSRERILATAGTKITATAAAAAGCSDAATAATVWIGRWILLVGKADRNLLVPTWPEC